MAGIGSAQPQLAAAGGTRGVGSIIVLPPGGCLLTETARILRFQAHAGARQCGPCMFGLPAIAADMTRLGPATAAPSTGCARRLPVINGRGGCGHPDGAVALAASALSAAATSEPGTSTSTWPSAGARPDPVVPLIRRHSAPNGASGSGRP